VSWHYVGLGERVGHLGGATASVLLPQPPFSLLPKLSTFDKLEFTAKAASTTSHNRRNMRGLAAHKYLLNDTCRSKPHDLYEVWPEI
jgi:hypothetical protein